MNNARSGTTFSNLGVIGESFLEIPLRVRNCTYKTAIEAVQSFRIGEVYLPKQGVRALSVSVSSFVANLPATRCAFQFAFQ